MAVRPEGLDGSHDISDIESLADAAGIVDAEAALSLVEAFYPASRIPPKVRFGLEEIMANVVARRAAESSVRELRIHEQSRNREPDTDRGFDPME